MSYKVEANWVVTHSSDHETFEEAIGLAKDIALGAERAPATVTGPDLWAQVVAKTSKEPT